MEYNILGKTDLKVSKIGLGTVELGMPYEIGLPPPPPDDDCIRLLRTAYETGITYFDTAAAYGRSEELVGRAFADFSDKPILATKVNLHAEPNTPPLEGRALEAHIEYSLHRSLRLLGLDRLDLLQLHNADPQYITPHLLDIMEGYCSKGLVRYWGASTYGEQAALGVLAQAEHFSTLQVAYNLLDQSAAGQVFKEVDSTRTGLVLRSVFLKGLLSHRFRDQALPPHLAPLQRTIEALENLLAPFDLTIPQVAFRFAAFCPSAHIALFGTTQVAEMAQNVAAFAAGPLPPEVLAGLNNLEIEDESLLNPGTWGF